LYFVCILFLPDKLNANKMQVKYKPTSEPRVEKGGRWQRGAVEGRWRVGVNAKASEGGGMGWEKSSSTIIFILKQSKNMIIPKMIRIFATY
jgi:hypothetical protein